MSKKKNEWVVYPEVELTIDDLKKHFNMPENEEDVIFTPKIEEEGKIDEFPVFDETPVFVPEEKTPTSGITEQELSGSTEHVLTDPEDLNKKNYVKISPTFYIQYVKSEEPVENDEKKEIYKIFNPQTGVIEKRELTDNEKHEVAITELKESKIRFRNVKHDGNKTTNQFGATYRKARKNKNRMQKKSRKLTRKK
jgi:hypothetical protein